VATDNVLPDYARPEELIAATGANFVSVVIGHFYCSDRRARRVLAGSSGGDFICLPA